MVRRGFFDKTLVLGVLPDETGTGKGGQSIWGRPFSDEIRQTLKVRRMIQRG